MRSPLTKYATREIVLFGAFGLVLTAVVAAIPGWFWLLSAIPLAFTVWVVWFFRDPPRRVPTGERLLLAPADGRVTHVETIDAPDELDGPGPALRISIFLSIFDCHLNRAPCAGSVQRVVRRQGRFLNAMNPASATENEQAIIVLKPDAVAGPVLVRQVAGAIARRIVCEVREGDHLATGQKFGMIKFGSRTDLVVSGEVPVDVRVKVGDKVKAGLTVLGQFG